MAHVQFDKETLADKVREYLAIERKDPERIYSLLELEYADCGADEDGETIWLDYRFTATRRHLNVYDSVHGGATATLFDQGLGVFTCAVTGKDNLTTTDMTISYLRAMREGPYRIHCELTHAGRRVVSGRGWIYDDRQRPCATALVTYIVFGGPDSSPYK